MGSRVSHSPKGQRAKGAIRGVSLRISIRASSNTFTKVRARLVVFARSVNLDGETVIKIAVEPTSTREGCTPLSQAKHSKAKQSKARPDKAASST